MPAPAVNPTQAAFVIDRMSDISFTSKGRTFTVFYKGPNDSTTILAFYAALPFGTPHATYAGSTVREFVERPVGGSGVSGGMVEIGVVYKPDEVSASGVLGGMTPGESILEADSNTVEEPIEKLPPEARRQTITQAAWLDDLPSRQQDSLAGIKGWLNPQPTVTRTDAVDSSSFTFTEAQIIGHVGRVMKAGAIGDWGVSSPEQDADGKTKWLYTGKRITKNGDTVTIQRTAQYASQGWETSYVYRSDGTESPENP